MNGIVKFFNRKKGFGCINGEDKNEYYFHRSQTPNKMMLFYQNDIVSFEAAQLNNGKNLKAINVKPVLTMEMILKKLDKKKSCLMKTWDAKGEHGYYVIDKLDKQFAKMNMNLLQLGEYVGFDGIDDLTYLYQKEEGEMKNEK